MRFGLHFILAAAALLGTTAAVAQELTGADAIKARQASYRETGTAYKAINDELRKDAPGHFALASSARQIAANLPQVVSLFPAGSGPEAGVKTKAKPAIWTNRATFERANAAAVQQANALVAATRATDVAAMRLQLQALGKTCKACHDQFREQD